MVRVRVRGYGQVGLMGNGKMGNGVLDRSRSSV